MVISPLLSARTAAGKSTLLRTLSRLMTPTQGHVYLGWRRDPALRQQRGGATDWPAGAKRTTPGDISVQETGGARVVTPHQPLFSRWRQEDEDAVQNAMQALGLSIWRVKAWTHSPVGSDSARGLRWCWHRTRRLCCSTSRRRAGYQPSDRPAGSC
ncbi:iron-enterobactin transporter ATP-binding protein [Kluyvera cryocrescens]|uniref:Iron-enterobactin transporter ATP-binding protein n=1 Tax=Kluyvera cryocrescens TaxID=580 RepID=A0A485CJD5_KLUCR|nr:iron-enterobactin transporter ATP-binding protein [Kluyvera cryocrescens]